MEAGTCTSASVRVHVAGFFRVGKTKRLSVGRKRVCRRRQSTTKQNERQSVIYGTLAERERETKHENHGTKDTTPKHTRTERERDREREHENATQQNQADSREIAIDTSGNSIPRHPLLKRTLPPIHTHTDRKHTRHECAHTRKGKETDRQTDRRGGRKQCGAAPRPPCRLREADSQPASQSASQ